MASPLLGLAAILALAPLGARAAQAAAQEPLPPRPPVEAPAEAAPSEREPAPFVGPPLPPEPSSAADLPQPAAAAARAHGAGPQAPAQPHAAARPPADAIRAIVGLLAVFALAYVGGLPAVQRFERRLGLGPVMAAGLPFVLLGTAAAHPRAGVLTEGVLADIAPLLPFGLGWLGFGAGFRFDADRLQALQSGLGRLVALTALLPLALVTASCALMLLTQIEALPGESLARGALLLGCASMLTARTRLEPAAGGDERLLRVVQIHELLALVALLLVSAFFRPPAAVAGWELPGLAWAFVGLGMAAAMAALVYASFTQFRGTAELALVLIGATALTAGLASHLRLSPVAVCFLSGLLLANLPSTWKGEVRSALAQLERPIYLVFLVVAGALWRWGDWQGWVLLLSFVAARIAGRVLALQAARGDTGLAPEERRSLELAPMGALSIAVAVNAQDLFAGPAIPWIVTAILGGAFLGEVLAQAGAAWRRGGAAAPARGA